MNLWVILWADFMRQTNLYPLDLHSKTNTWEIGEGENDEEERYARRVRVNYTCNSFQFQKRIRGRGEGENNDEERHARRPAGTPGECERVSARQLVKYVHADLSGKCFCTPCTPLVLSCTPKNFTDSAILCRLGLEYGGRARK